MQPALSCHSKLYPQYAPMVWDLALRTAAAASACSQRAGDGEGHKAHLMGLLSYISEIALFQLTLETFAQASQSAPRPAIFHEVYKQSRDELMARLIDNGSLGAAIQGDMQDFFQQRPLNQCSGLSRSVYLGRLMAAVTLLATKGLVSKAAGQRLLLAKGLPISDLDITGRLTANLLSRL
jgi:hypothetical protein